MTTFLIILSFFSTLAACYFWAENRSLKRLVTRQDEEIKNGVAERKVLTDGVMLAAHKPTIYNRPLPEPVSQVPLVAFGPTMSAARQDAKRQETETIIKRAQEARRNGQVDIPTIPGP